MENGKFRYLSELHREEAAKLKSEEKWIPWKVVAAGACLALTVTGDGPIRAWALFLAVGSIYIVVTAEIRIARLKSHLDNIALHRFAVSDYKED